jgi:hypothetical protein
LQKAIGHLSFWFSTPSLYRRELLALFLANKVLWHFCELRAISVRRTLPEV